MLWVLFLTLGGIAMAAQPAREVYAAQTQEDNAGFVKRSGKTYYYQNGKKVTGLKKINGSLYYFSKKGVMKTKGFQKVKGKKYYFGKDGKAYTGLQKVGKKTYYFNEKGVMQYGLQKVSGSYYYFSKLTGTMQTKKFQTVGKKKYYFGANGKACTGLKTINKQLYYFDKKGVVQKGWQTIGGSQYYFDTDGRAYKNTTRKIGDIYAAFNSEGVYQITASYCMVGGKRMQVQYLTDPKVSDETLLAAILYAEAGGETQSRLTAQIQDEAYLLYKGQMAVGYTIMNRLEHKSYPGTLKEVIYAQYQFEPARTGVLTKFLENPALISQACKDAAKVLLHDQKYHTESVSSYPRSEFKWYNFWALGYAKTRSNFFSVYSEQEYEIIGNQVFFNFTKNIISY